MVERVIRWSAGHRKTVVVAVTLVAVMAYLSLRYVALDAIPDLSDTQVIVKAEWKGRSPDLIENQITYPVVTSLVSIPHAKTVRGYSMFGMSYVYVIFKEGTDIYWARSRILESLSRIQGQLPEGVTPSLGPDATGVGWVYEYALVDPSGGHDLSEIRAFQDWTLRYWLESVEGVAEVATVGGFEKQYQVLVDPDQLRGRGATLDEVVDAVRGSGGEVGARVVERGGREYAIRSRRYVRDPSDIASSAVRVDDGVPVLVQDVAIVRVGPDIRRGAADLDGQGETVGGIVIMRHGENALRVIDRVKQRLAEAEKGFPAGIRLRTVYDRSDLIRGSIDTLRTTIIEEMIMVALVILLFLLHVRSSIVPILTLPIAALMAFLPMVLLGVSSNIMSLGGIAIAIGAMVDASMVLVENAHKRLERAPPGADRKEIITGAAAEVGRPLFFALLMITVSFLPVFTLTGQAGRLFSPLAYTKTFSMAFAAILAVTLTPALMVWLIRGRIRPEARNPISRGLVAFYRPVIHLVLRHRYAAILAALLIMAFTIPVVPRVGREFMPALDEGSLLYMPTTLPGISIEEARRSLSVQDGILKSFPEVRTVFGKVGRSTTSTDPAPLDMIETVIMLKPKSEWRTIQVRRWYSDLAPESLKALLRPLWPEERPMTMQELEDEMYAALKIPGWVNSLSPPIKTRIDMLSTGVRTPVGIKVLGPSLEEVEKVATEVEKAIRTVPGTRSVFAERPGGGYYLDITPKRDVIARYGLRVSDVQDVIATAIGGMEAGVTVQGRERYSILVRLNQDFRFDQDAIARIPVSRSEGGPVPLGQVADIRVSEGPSMIRDENGSIAAYVFVDVDETNRDLGGYVDEAKRTVTASLRNHPGVRLQWTGQFELLEEMWSTLRYVIPLTLLLIIVFVYLSFRGVTQTALKLLSLPFAAVGSVWLMYLAGYHFSTASIVGLIALMGVGAETGIVMIQFIDDAYHRRRDAGLMRGLQDIYEAHAEGSIERVRPKVMTVATTILGLVPILWSQGIGADVMKRIAAPMVGGLVSSTILTLVIIPSVYTVWRDLELRNLWRRTVMLLCCLALTAGLPVCAAFVPAVRGVLPNPWLAAIPLTVLSAALGLHFRFKSRSPLLDDPGRLSS